MTILPRTNDADVNTVTRDDEQVMTCIDWDGRVANNTDEQVLTTGVTAGDALRCTSDDRRNTSRCQDNKLKSS